MMASCNNDVFIDHPSISSDTGLIDWKGGSAVIDISSSQTAEAFIQVSRLIDGFSYQIDDLYGSWVGEAATPFSNRLIDMSARIDDNHLIIDLDHSYYPDTINVNISINTAYETLQKNLTILPADPFTNGQINYWTNSWQSDYTTKAMWGTAYINTLDEYKDYTVLQQGQVIASRTGRFEAYDVPLSEVVLPQDKEFWVPFVDMGNVLPFISTSTIPYSAATQEIGTMPLKCESDRTITVPPNTSCHITLLVQFERSGFSYVIPATSPDGKVDIDVEGIFWLSVPISYQLSTEMTPLR